MVGQDDGDVSAWSMRTLRQIQVLSGTGARVQSLAICPAENSLAFGDVRGAVLCWKYDPPEGWAERYAQLLIDLEAIAHRTGPAEAQPTGVGPPC